MGPEDTPSVLDDPILKDVPVSDGQKVLGDVVLSCRAGKGGFGVVYKGHHPRLALDVAVKVMALPPHIPDDRVEHYIQRFIREARMAAAVRHTNLVRVIDVNHMHGVHFLVMDFVDGQTAAERLRARGPLREEQALKICAGAASGLAEAHRQGIVHRDVKPQNILIDHGRVRVSDLGLAKAYNTRSESDAATAVTESREVVGTAAYMPPEQFGATSTVAPPADVWSLGVTLFQLLTAKVPWDDPNVFNLAHMIMNDPAPEVRSIRSDLSNGTNAIIAKSLSKDPADRFPDCGVMSEALRLHVRWMAQ